VIERLQRVLQFARDDAPAVKLGKLEQTLSRYEFPQADTLALFAALLSLPAPEGVPPLMPSPQKQKEQTLEALVRWLFEEADGNVVYTAWEDLHWADPSTLEFLSLCLDQIPTARMRTSCALESGWIRVQARTVGPIGWNWYSNEVTIPKSPPAPRTPQKRSAFSFSFATKRQPSAVTSQAVFASKPTGTPTEGEAGQANG